MNRIALAMIAALSLGGCSTGYKWDTDRNGNVYLAGTYQRYDPDKAQAIGNELQSGASRFATGYANASPQTVYVQPAYQPDYVPPLPRTAIVTPLGFGSFGQPSYNVSY
jgi:hypothetical protein